MPAHAATGPFTSRAAAHELTPILAETTPAQMHRVWGAALHSDAQRVAMAKSLGKLDTPTELARLSAPGRVYRGARWRPGEDILPKGLRDQKARVDLLQTKVNDSMAADSKRVAQGSLPKQLVGGGSTRTRNLRGALHVQEDVLAAMEKSHITRTGLNPADYYGRPSGLTGAEDFTGGRVYVPSKRAGQTVGVGPFKVSTDILPKTVKPPPGFRGPYQGALPLAGEEARNFPQLVGESGLQMQRAFQGTQRLKHLQEIAISGEHVPEDLKNWQAVRLGEMSDQAKNDLNNALAALKQSQKPTRKGLNALNRAAGGMLDHMLPEAEMKSYLDEHGSFGFVPKALVGDRGSYDPVGKFEAGFNHLSDTLKKAVVYTKIPGHIPPRFASNTIFNIGQQGYKLLPTAVKTLALFRRYPELAPWVDSSVGHGGFGAIAATPLEKALVRPVQRLADRNPRRFSFVYEVQKDAGRSLSVDELAQRIRELEAAHPDSELHQRLINIDQRSAVHAGEYQRMSAAEKRYVSKVLFLWAWHRTAAVTTAKFALEHPVAAGAVGAGSYYLNENVNAHQPPWEKWAVPVPGGKISNLATSLPFSSPVEDARTIAATGRALTGGVPTFGEGLIGQVNPLLTLLAEAGSGRNLETGGALKQGPLMAFLKRTPPGALISGKGQLEGRIGKYLVGNPFPQVSSSATSSSGSFNPSGLKNLEKQGKITPAQYTRIMQLMKQAPALEAQARKRVAQLQAGRGVPQPRGISIPRGGAPGTRGVKITRRG